MCLSVCLLCSMLCACFSVLCCVCCACPSSTFQRPEKSIWKGKINSFLSFLPLNTNFPTSRVVFRLFSLLTDWWLAGCLTCTSTFNSLTQFPRKSIHLADMNFKVVGCCWQWRVDLNVLESQPASSNYRLMMIMMMMKKRYHSDCVSNRIESTQQQHRYIFVFILCVSSSFIYVWMWSLLSFVEVSETVLLELPLMEIILIMKRERVE